MRLAFTWTWLLAGCVPAATLLPGAEHVTVTFADPPHADPSCGGWDFVYRVRGLAYRLRRGVTQQAAGAAGPPTPE